MRRDLGTLAALVVVAAVLLLSPRADAAIRRYAVIVAYAGHSAAGLAPLEYADDDGARYHELFSRIADDVRLFTVLDESTQRTHPQSARAARAPRREDVLAGLAHVFSRARRDVAAGDEVVFYFVLVGHGKIGDGGEGYVPLLDGSFTRTDMFQEVLAKSPATTNHVIVDACNAYFMVHRRGGDAAPARKDAVQAFVSRESLTKYPNTGLLLSTSTEKDTHEWSVYRAGVFSHQVRSALAGGADVNGDGEVAYSEIAAFLAAANQHVTASARVDVFVKAPASDAARPLVDLKHATFSHWLRIPSGKPLRLYLEDSRAVRYADLHLGGEAVTLGLVPSSHYYVRTNDGAKEIRLELEAIARIDLARDRMTPTTISARGALDESFRIHLYEEPFDADYYRGFTAASDARPVPFDAPRWQPGPVDAGVVDDELRRLNHAARTDVALRRRLSTSAIELARLLDAAAYDAALAILRRAEAR